MTEKELVKWFTPSIKEGFQIATKLADDAESFEDLRNLCARLRATAKDLKGSIVMMENYVSVNETIMDEPIK